VFDNSPPENLDVYEIMREDTVELDRSQLTVRCTGIVRWITRATDTHSDYVISIHIAFPLEHW